MAVATIPLSYAPAQAKKALGVDDYTRWRTVDESELSGDGRWLVFGMRHTNVPTAATRPQLTLQRLDDNQVVTVADASQASFSPDSRWVTYIIDPPPAAARAGAPRDSSADTTGGRGRGAAPATPPVRRLELRELATGRIRSWQDVQSASFSPTGSHLLIRFRAPSGAAAAGRAGGAPAAAPAGARAGGAGGSNRGDALVHDLATGRSVFLGSIGEVSFNRPGTLLAYAVDAPVRDGNGLFVMDLAAGRMHALDNDGRIYARLTWNDAGTALAAVKGREVPRMRERDNTVLVFRDVAAAMAGTAQPVLLDTQAAGFPRNFVITERATLDWSDDGQRVFFGIIGQSAAPDTARRASPDSTADVDIWRTMDDRIQSLQMIRADADRNLTFRQAMDVAGTRFIPLADSTMRDLEIGADGRWAVGRDLRAHVTERQRPRGDVYRVNTATGERTLLLKNHPTAAVYGIAPTGKHLLYWKDARIHVYDLDAATTTMIGRDAPNFTDLEYDYPGDKPSYGIAGYTPDGRSVIVHHRYDLWQVALDGRAPSRNLTNGVGSKEEIRFRVVRTDPVDPMAPRAQRERRWIDLSQPVTLSALGQWTKKNGFYELANGTLRPIVYEDASFSTPTRAAKGDRYLFTRQTFSEFPDLRVSGPAFADSRKVSDANPQQAEYQWGRRILFDYRTRRGVKLQGVLALPDDYKAGEKRPMIVTFYEKNSQNLHRYSAPSYITGMGAHVMEAVSRGYITMLADVHFHTGSSHSDMLDAVEAATRKVIEMGYADPKRIGVHGHSYGGEGAAFIAGRSRLFAAVGMGAGVSDLTSDFLQSWGWSYQVNSGSGANAFDYYLYGQGRWGFSPWDKPEVYRYESAITHAPNVRAPVLIMHGTADPTVGFPEGMNYYSALRYNQKEAYMLAYPGEAHGLRNLGNRRDLTIRYFQFFDHYLKGAPAPKWMTDGVPFLAKEPVRDPR
jgi:dienelactone hydrolase